MRLRIFLAALGVALNVALSGLGAVPAIYSILDRSSLSRVHLFLVPLLAQAAILMVLVMLWRGKPLRRSAAAAALLMALQLAETLLARPSNQGMLLLWLFGELLSDFAWVVLLVLFARESKPLECTETRFVALMLALSIVLNTLGYGYILSGNWTVAYNEFTWLAPVGAWKAAAVAVSAVIHLGRAAALVYFLAGVFHNPAPVNSPLDT